MLRWHVIPRNRWFNIYLHKIYGDDDERATHDHPWSSLSIKLWGGELIEIFDCQPFNVECTITPPRIAYRDAELSHRLEVPGKPVWTLFITGPYKREWGFNCPSGWVHWSKMTTKDGKKIGGCE